MKLTYFFDYSSPYAYIGARAIEALATEAGVSLKWHPFLLGGLFKTIGTPMVPLDAMAPAKRAYNVKEMHRWAAFRELTFAFPSRFPMNTVTALRMTLQLSQEEMPRLAHAIFRAYWADDRDINDKAVLGNIADEAGFDGAGLLAGTQNPEIKDQLKQHTQAAVDAGLCGAPSVLVQEGADDAGMLFWGQDRYDMVKKALSGWRPACG